MNTLKNEEPRIYMVEHDTGTDIFTTVCKNKEEANREAQEQWKYLGINQRKYDRIHVVYTKKTDAYYDDLGEDWSPEAYICSDADDDDFDSNRRLDYKYYDCGCNFQMFDDDHSMRTVIDYGYMKYFYENPEAYDSIEDIKWEIRKDLEEEIAEHFPGNDEDRVEDVIESILITIGYLLYDNLWNYDFETGKRTDE